MKWLNKTGAMLLFFDEIHFGLQILCCNTQHHICGHVWRDAVVILHNHCSIDDIFSFKSLRYCSWENLFFCLPGSALGSHWSPPRASLCPLAPLVPSKPKGSPHVSSYFFHTWPPAIPAQREVMLRWQYVLKFICLKRSPENMIPSIHLGGWRSYGSWSLANTAGGCLLKALLWHNKGSLFFLFEVKLHKLMHVYVPEILANIRLKWN